MNELFILTTKSSNLLTYLLKHAHRVRSIIYILNNDNITQVECINQQNQQKDIKKQIWNDLHKYQLSTIIGNNFNKINLGEIFIPWNNINSTGFLMAELIKYYKRQHPQNIKKNNLKVDNEQNEENNEEDNEEDEEEEEDIETIKEEVMLLIKKKIKLLRTTLSLKWSLTGIAIIALMLFKQNQFNEM